MAHTIIKAPSQHLGMLKAFCGNELSQAAERADFDFLLEAQRKNIKIENYTDANGQTALHVAAKSENPAVLELLLDGRAEVDCRDAKGETPLHVALAHKNLNGAHLLISSGANVNKQIKKLPPTPVGRAVIGPEPEPVPRLFPVDPLRADEELDSEPEEEADEDQDSSSNASGEEHDGGDSGDDDDGSDGSEEEEDDDEALRLENSTPLHSAILDGNETLVTFLVENGADLNAQNGLAETPLHLSVERGLDKVSVYLVSKGARALHDHNGMTPLHVAFKSNNMAMMCFLAEQGFDVGIQAGPAGATPADALAAAVEAKLTVTKKPLPGKKGPAGGTFKAPSTGIGGNPAPVVKPAAKSGAVTASEAKKLPTPRVLPKKK